jgi:glycosyltransferase involved in cell wall biosynthesis
MEGLVFNSYLGTACVALLFGISLPLSAFEQFLLRRRSAWSGFSAVPRIRQRAGSSGFGGAPGASCCFTDFAAEDAIAAYEELIDSTCLGGFSRHVALVIPTLDRMGSAERQVILLAGGLCRRGWQVTVVALSSQGGTAVHELRATGAGFLSLGMGTSIADPRGWFRFIVWLRRVRPEVVHAHLAQAIWLARWSRLFASVPIVIDTFHCPPAARLWKRLSYRLSRWLPDRITAVSNSVAESHVMARAVSWKNLTVLPNGIDLDEWRPDSRMRSTVRSEMGIEDQFLWVAVGRLEMVKDYPTLLKAMATLPRSARLVIAGSGPLRENLSWLTASLGLAGRVRFLGYDPNVKRWLQAADGFVLASRWEGLPMALLEAAACELPAAVTDVPGIREVIEDGETGMLAPVMDAAALACAMTAIMQASAEDRHTMGERARQGVTERFSLESAIDSWEKLYEDLLLKKFRAGSSRRAAAAKQRCAHAAGNTSTS